MGKRGASAKQPPAKRVRKEKSRQDPAASMAVLPAAPIHLNMDAPAGAQVQLPEAPAAAQVQLPEAAPAAGNADSAAGNGGAAPQAGEAAAQAPVAAAQAPAEPFKGEPRYRATDRVKSWFFSEILKQAKIRKPSTKHRDIVPQARTTRHTHCGA